MLPDNRLDFITNIQPAYIKSMTTIREEFIALENKIKSIGDNTTDSSVLRCVSISRTHIETALQYAIKALCIMGEDKE